MYNKRFQNQRKNIRLENFDYSSPGAYFITICTQTRNVNWFGHITRDGMQSNAVGQMILKTWNNLSTIYQGIQANTFIIMPDHIHGIIIIESQNLVGADLRVRPAQANSIGDIAQVNSIGDIAQVNNIGDIAQVNNIGDIALAVGESGQTRRSAPTDSGGLSLSDVMQRFKTYTTNEYIRGVCELGWLPFEKRFWQRNFWERVIQNEREFEETQAYILENPVRWLEARGVL
jgi:putative transposase